MFADDDMDNVIMDVHIYQAWSQPDTVAEACKAYDDDVSRLVGHTKYPVWVGEWSFATDNCAHWLGGFNNGGMQPKKTCNNWSACPKSYLPAEFAVDFDRTADMLGPFGGIPEKGCI
jgi:glucan 1,3-beta-glucosidase|tara:strand:- start:420 stop:770 length:351 start_codon:yes stop_codon:yes gene_type:complete